MIEPMLWFFALIGMLFCLYHAGRLAALAFHRLGAWGSQVRVISIRRLQSSYSLHSFACAADLAYVETYERLEEMLAYAGVEGAWYEYQAVYRRNSGFSRIREDAVTISDRRVPLEEVLNALKAIGGKPERVPAVEYRHAEVTRGDSEKQSSRTPLLIAYQDIDSL